MSKAQRRDNDRLMDCVRTYKLNKNQDAFDEIVVALEGYLNHLAYKKFFYVAGGNRDDIYQEALTALACKAIPDYDESKGSFLGFARLCIKRHIITVVKSANSLRNGVLNESMSLESTVIDDDDGPISISGFRDNGEEAIPEKLVRLETHARLKQTLKDYLTPLERRVLDLYLKNKSYVEIVESMSPRKHRGARKALCKKVDNALCRIKHKAVMLDRALKEGKIPSKDDLR